MEITVKITAITEITVTMKITAEITVIMRITAIMKAATIIQAARRKIRKTPVCRRIPAMAIAI